MKLTVGERLILLQLLEPIERNFLTLKIARDLTSNLAMNDKEFKEYNIKQVGTQITWDSEKGIKETEIEIGEKANDIIVEELNKLNDAIPPKLQQRHFSLYQKFVEKKKVVD